MTKDIETRFREFHGANPSVYTTLVGLAKDLKKQGYKQGAIEMLWQVLRWQVMSAKPYDPNGSEFKLNDHYRSRYARMIMENEEDLDGFFEIRVLRS